MLGDESRRETLDGVADAREMSSVETLDAAQRQADAVAGDRVVAANGVEPCGRRAAAEIVLGVNLEPGDAGSRLSDGPVMRKAQADPRPSGDRTVFRRYGGGTRGHPPPRAQPACRVPPAILPQSPPGSSTNDLGSRACV